MCLRSPVAKQFDRARGAGKGLHCHYIQPRIQHQTICKFLIFTNKSYNTAAILVGQLTGLFTKWKYMASGIGTV
jgi:hypothetical protein